ncbi:DUF305 domain-containing protein [Oceaniglobus indicus]|uniref:DUF305 domain-containing protein n=1 Tax=Oceaniglobus indicus TaxID=2047749 RepID=UPI000C17587F|nr:DUF305 domain-containing protein [Oceaniglobus indicus]
MGYGRFFAMIATSTVVMFGLMYLNTYLIGHVFWSETRAYMAVLMGATMAIIMLAFMLSMYSNKTVNAAIFAGAVIAFGGSLWLVRSQVTVADTSYMRAMIPHHSIAIMTSTRANLSDPRVRKLADEIIYAQDKEIAEMRYLIADIEAGGDAALVEPDRTRQVVSIAEALGSANVATVDPGFLSAEDIAMVFPQGASCTFDYTTESKPALAVGTVNGVTTGLVKISGDLVRLASDGPVNAPAVLGADGIGVQIASPDDVGFTETAEPQEADMIVTLDAGLKAGFRGWYDCAG